MKRKHAGQAIAAIAMLMFLWAPLAQAQMTIGEFTKDWPEVSRNAAVEMVKKYGAPTGHSPARLLWVNQDPWHHIVVHREPVQHNFPMPHEDVLEQAVPLRVPVDKIDELAAFDGSIIVDRTAGVVAARCDREEMNILALNLANDILTGAKTVDQARSEYARIAEKAKSGGMDEYTSALRFAPVSSDQTADPDRPAMATGPAREGTTGTGTTGMGTQDTVKTTQPDTLDRE